MRDRLLPGYRGTPTNPRDRAAAPELKTQVVPGDAFRQRWTASQHEASHFVEAAKRGAKPQPVKVTSQGGGEMLMDSALTDEQDVAIRLAGPIAQLVLDGDRSMAGCDKDFEDAHRLAKRIWGATADTELDRIMCEVGQS